MYTESAFQRGEEMIRKVDIDWSDQYDFYELRKRSMVPLQDQTYLLYMFLENRRKNWGQGRIGVRPEG